MGAGGARDAGSLARDVFTGNGYEKAIIACGRLQKV